MSNFDTSIVEIDVADINIGIHVKNIRTVFNEQGIKDLATSIQRDGLMNPLIVSSGEDEKGNVVIELVAGERRYRAIQYIQKNLDSTFMAQGIPCISYVGTAHDAEFVNALENIDREDVDEVDLSQYLHRRAGEGVTPTELAEKLNRSVAWVTDRITFWERACQELKDLLRLGQYISASAAFELAKNLNKDDQKKRVASAIKFGEKISVEDAKRADDPNKTSKPGKKAKELLMAEAMKEASTNPVAYGISASLKWVDGLLTQEEIEEIMHSGPLPPEP